MAAFSTIAAGIGAAASAFGVAKSAGLFGGGSSGGNTVGGFNIYDMLIAQNQQQQSQLAQKQIDIDATRRRRDIIRQAQVTTAQATANAYSQGAGEASALQDAIGGISGQEGTNLRGVELNQELANEGQSLQQQKGALMWQQSADRSRSQGQQSLNDTLMKNLPGIGKLADFGWGTVKNAFSQSSTGWSSGWDMDYSGTA